ncbi:CLUMA_CG017588, isoform C [Clunio marinus]|uniref:CLUMA_CG017588, isoform C n=1 Tax=Clunio marinus TaxID=568069 RepID=A0A1J1IWH6_9DIPT|nr:CLUMA_CG017588, isoform C [Clunio marinus]
MTLNNTLTDKEYYQLTISIGKAFNSYEAPVKSKHVRAAIIGTYHSNGGHAFWAIAIRQPLQENRITAWKFCHVLHKILREGHPLVLQHSMRHRTMITEIGKLWGHLNDGYGLCIKHYTKLLVTKIEFHDRNPRFPGSLVLKRGELEQIAGNDINVYFQLAVEMFDYLDEIVALQATIFNSITTFTVSSLSLPGQCRLAPLIPCIQDSNQLYDFVVRLMFLLHANLPDDLLNGHRERFRTLFRQLHNFYKQAGTLQYFVNLIKVPSLPSNPPNFLVQSDLGNYTAPVVVVPQESNDSDTNSVVDNLVDTSPELPERTKTPPPLPHVDFDRLLKERDELIRHMQQEISKQNEIVKSKEIEKREYENRVQDHITKINNDLLEAQQELTNTRLQKEEIELKLQTAPDLEEKVQAEEERAKATEDKFQKLKNMYTQIRDEHIKLLRQHGEVSKQSAENTRLLTEASQEKEEFKAKLEEIQREQEITKESLQQSASETERQKDELSEKVKTTERENLTLLEKVQDIESNKSAEIAELKIVVDKLQKSLNEQRESSMKLDGEKENLESKYQEMLSKTADVESSYQETLASLEKLRIVEIEKQQLDQEFEQQKASNDALSSQIEQKNSEYESLEIKLNEHLENSAKEIESLQQQIQANDEKFQETLDQNHNEALEKIQKLELDLINQKIQGEAALRALLETCVKTSAKITLRAITESETPGASGTTTYFIMIAEELQDVLEKLKLVHGNYLEDNNKNAEALVRKVQATGHLISSVHEQGMAICNKSTNIDSGEKIANELREFGKSVSNFFESLHTTSKSDTVNPQINDMKEQLYKVTQMIGDLSNNNDEIDQLGDLVEKELSSMDKAIEDAAQKIVDMLTQTKTSDSGIKLEVNEKILDACTNLMRAIQILVQKSRKVQSEIVAQGKGSASVKEFYKRNHQWTEGLISAAKSVANGAKFLVDAADKAVTGESKHTLDIVVAAQEIAACTAQLVVASRVKAPRQSQNLQELTQASRNVTQSTGIVVATAKDCSQRLDEGQDLDFTKLSIHQAKTKEMEVQVKVLELEQALEMERLKLSALRRQNYQSME